VVGKALWRWPYQDKGPSEAEQRMTVGQVYPPLGSLTHVKLFPLWSPIWVGTFCFSKRFSCFEKECLRKNSKGVCKGTT
jgi:hypothetical protein